MFYFDDVFPGGARRRLSAGRHPAPPAPGLPPAATAAGAAGGGAHRGGAAPGAGRGDRSRGVGGGSGHSPRRRTGPVGAPAPAATGGAPSRRPVPPGRSTTTAPSAPVTTAAAPPPSTLPARPAVLVAASGGTAIYQLTSPAASIVVKASGPCWIEVKAGSPRGQVVVEKTLAAGQRSSVIGPAWVRLGDPPHVAVTVDGTPMSVPGAGTAVPLDLQFILG